jgi:type II secretory pathway pseudopilin PulG
VTRAKSPCPNFRRRAERGYVLLTLLLFVSLLVIAAAAMAPSIGRQLKRDREEELIHRGIEYRRAIRAFAKHTGQFPLSIDQLENTNGVRYLRKRYKDPITGGDFRLLHMNDIAATGARLDTASPPPDQSASAATSDPSAVGTQAATSADASADLNGTPKPPDGRASQTSSAFTSSTARSGTDFGGGVIFGVVSSSAKQSIREFDHKNHYNQWLFFYSAIYDGSVEVKGPTPMRPVFAAQKSSPESANPGTPTASSQPQQ